MSAIRGFGRNGSRGIAGGSIKTNDERCICPKCGQKISRKMGIPCEEIECPQCDTIMKNKNEER